jgi:hypothetical protein
VADRACHDTLLFEEHDHARLLRPYRAGPGLSGDRGGGCGGARRPGVWLLRLDRTQDRESHGDDRRSMTTGNADTYRVLSEMRSQTRPKLNIFTLLAGLALVVYPSIVLWREMRFRDAGIVTEGSVVWKGATTTMRLGGFARHYARGYVAYRFATPDGRQLTDTDKVSLARWETLRQGGPIRLIFLPTDPEKNEVDGEIWSRVPNHVPPLLLGVLFLVFGAFGFWRDRRLNATVRRAMDEVQAAESAKPPTART